jgi:hypothetical protein
MRAKSFDPKSSKAWDSRARKPAALASVAGKSNSCGRNDWVSSVGTIASRDG